MPTVFFVAGIGIAVAISQFNELAGLEKALVMAAGAGSGYVLGELWKRRRK